jgi:hypothetical protein
VEPLQRFLRQAQSIGLLDFGVEITCGVRPDFDGLAVGEVLKEDGGVGPFEVPTVFECEERVASGKKGRHREGAVGIALVAVEERGVLVGIPGNEKNHGARKRFSVFEGKTGQGAFCFGGMDG